MDFLEEMKQRGYYYDEQLGRLVKDEFIRDPELATKKWQTLRKQCGCDNCDECGNNGCGSILIDGWEFDDVEQGYVGAVSVRREGPTCYKKDAERREEAERDEYMRMKADIEDGTTITIRPAGAPTTQRGVLFWRHDGRKKGHTQENTFRGIEAGQVHLPILRQAGTRRGAQHRPHNSHR